MRSDIVDAALSRQRLGMALMLGFGIAAVALAAVGIYGVIAYGAAQRRNEVAIRLALGATPGTVFWLTLKQGRAVAIVGAAIGLAVAYVSGRLISSWLYEVRASDPVILGAATMLVVGIALVATMIPAIAPPDRSSAGSSARILTPERIGVNCKSRPATLQASLADSSLTQAANNVAIVDGTPDQRPGAGADDRTERFRRRRAQ